MHALCSVSGRHDSGISPDLERCSRILRRPSASASMLMSVLHRTSQTSSSGSDAENGSIQQTASTGPKSISLSPERSPHCSEAEDVFDEKASSFDRKQQTLGVLSSPKKHHPPLKVGTSLTLMPDGKNKHLHIHGTRSVSVNEDFDPEIFRGSVTLGRNVEPAPLPIVSSTGKAFVQRSKSLDKRQKAFKKKRASTLDLNIQQV